jgi:hypothetical protein
MLMEIIREIVISGGEVLVNGAVDFSNGSNDHHLFLKRIYRHYGIDYPKFFKMSPMSKLGFLASELLLKDMDLSDTAPEKVSVVMANSSSSLHTDHIYQGTIDGKPSPAIFVYTLPNILIGEICIRTGFKGEGIFFVQRSFEKAFIFDYVESLLKTGRSEISLAGWVDIDINDVYLADLFLLKL